MTPPLKTPGGLGEPIRDSVRVLGIYIRGQLLLAGILVVVYGGVLAALRVPYWYLVALLAGVTSFIPSIGSLIPLGVAALVLYLNDADVYRYLWFFGAWLVIQALEFFVLIPRFIGKPLGLKEWPVLLALLAGSLLFGPVGFLLAVPVLAVGMVFWRYFRRPAK